MRMIGDELAAVLIGIRPSLARHLINEAFPVEVVLVEVHCPPVADRHVWNAHGVLYENVLDVVGHLVEKAFLHMLVDAILDGLRKLSQHRWTREPHVPCNGHTRGVEPRGHLGHRQGPVEVVLYVLLTAPKHFHRRFDLLGHERRIGDEVLWGSAPTEPAADKRGMQHDIAQGNPKRLRGELHGALGILGRSPDLGFVTDQVRRAVLWLHGRMSEVRRLILRLDSLCGFRKACRNISLFAPNAGIGCTQATNSVMDSVETFPFPPSSQLILSASAAVLARHHESATTATALGSFTTLRTPGMPLSFESSTDLSVPLNTGHWTRDAYNMFGTRRRCRRWACAAPC